MTLFNLVGQNFNPLRTDDYFLQEKWVDSILISMTIDEKIGQLFMIHAHRAHASTTIVAKYFSSLY